MILDLLYIKNKFKGTYNLYQSTLGRFPNALCLPDPLECIASSSVHALVGVETKGYRR